MTPSGACAEPAAIGSICAPIERLADAAKFCSGMATRSMTDWLSTGCRSAHEDCGPIERLREGLPALRLRRRGAKEARLGRPRLQEDVGRGPPRSGKQKVSERYDADERGREPRETLKLLLGRL